MTPCLCDPTIVCGELDCGGCECRVGTCWACAPVRAASAPPAPRPLTYGARRGAGDCGRDILPISTLRKDPTLRERYMRHRAYGLCDACYDRAARRAS